jgi:Icc-related predicted phosphoesterase
MLNQVNIPEGEILVHAGDALSRGTDKEFRKFINHFKKLPHPYKIYVPGNHDIFTEKNEPYVKSECAANGIIYLNNSGINILGLDFWGSGITPRFHNWAWNRDSGICGTSYRPSNPEYNPIEPYWDIIPENTDILVTHGPPHGILDVSIYSGEHCGCKRLLNKVNELKPKYHIFGHIHHWYGTQKIENTTFVNASICTEQYKPINKPIVLEINNE